VFIGTTDAAVIDAGGQLSFGGSYTGTTQTFWAGIAGRKENATDPDYAGYLQFSTRKNAGSSLERMRVTSDGNLGIGTTTPGLRTHINGITGFPATTGTAQTGVLRLQGLSSNSVLDFGVNGASGSYLQAGNQTALNATYPLLLNPNGGNVGIGTTAPFKKLHVLGGTMALTTSDFVSSGTGSSLLMGQNSTTGNVYSLVQAAIDGPNTGGILALNPNGGNVGIGTAVPDARLAVNGTIHTKEVRVDLTGWSDYVFNKEYVLPTLTEVKDYIDKNHHLPDMPSEKEVVTNGLNLGEMNKILTKKVEELTLYLIELSSQLKEQQKEIQRLKNKD
jgi:hypothetical protein